MSGLEADQPNAGHRKRGPPEPSQQLAFGWFTLSAPGFGMADDPLDHRPTSPQAAFQLVHPFVHIVNRQRWLDGAMTIDAFAIAALADPHVMHVAGGALNGGQFC